MPTPVDAFIPGVRPDRRHLRGDPAAPPAAPRWRCPIAGICVAILQRRRHAAAATPPPPRRRTSPAAPRWLGVGFPCAISAVILAALVFKATGLTSDDFATQEHTFVELVSKPDFFSFFVASCAGVAGMLSLTTATSAALIGGFISITTIPAAANAGIAAAYGDWTSFRGRSDSSWSTCRGSCWRER